jgi:hypothetical protein
MDKPSQWFGRADLVLLNDEEKTVKKAIVDITPWVPSWAVWASRDHLLHHWVSVRGSVKPHVVTRVRYELNAQDYGYLVDIKWETSCTIASVKFADGTTWRNASE